MKSVMMSLVAVAGLAVAASAAVNTTMEMLVSTDGTAFAPALAFNAGTGIHHVEVMVRVSYIPGSNGVGVVPIGFGSVNFQPVVNGWSSADAADAFANGGAGSNTSTPPGVVADAPGQFGRLSPWGRTALSTAQAITAMVQDGSQATATNPVPPGTHLRIAQRQVTAWIGGTGNTTGGSGVNIAQLDLNGARVSSDPAFNPSLLNVNIFRFGVEIDSGSAATGARVLSITAPEAGFGNIDSTSGERQAYWYGTSTENTGSIRGSVAVVDGLINILPVPTPGSLALLGLGGLCVARRRR